MECDWAADLADLRWHRGGAYRISHPAPDTWLAERKDNHQTLRAATTEKLLVLIRDDYARPPVPRNCARRERCHDQPSSYCLISDDAREIWRELHDS